MATALQRHRVRAPSTPHPVSGHGPAIPLRTSAPVDFGYILRCLAIVCVLFFPAIVYVSGFSAQTNANYARAKLRNKLRMLNLDHQRLKKAVDRARDRQTIEAWAQSEGMLLNAPPYVVRERNGL